MCQKCCLQLERMQGRGRSTLAGNAGAREPKQTQKPGLINYFTVVDQLGLTLTEQGLRGRQCQPAMMAPAQKDALRVAFCHPDLGLGGEQSSIADHWAPVRAGARLSPPPPWPRCRCGAAGGGRGYGAGGARAHRECCGLYR